MGYSMRVQDDTVRYGVNEYVIDTPADLDTIPLKGVEPGSSVLCLSTSDVYILASDKTWIAL